MSKITQSLSWQIESESSPLVAIAFQGETVGFCHAERSSQIVDALNNDETCRKALYLACEALTAYSAFSTEQLVQQFLAQVERPKSGVRAIGRLLQERQDALDLTDEEFAKFCDTFRLSREELRNILNGEELESSQIPSLSRILGISIEDLMEVWQGSASA